MGQGVALTSFPRLSGAAAFTLAPRGDGLGQHLVGVCAEWGVEGSPRLRGYLLALSWELWDEVAGRGPGTMRAGLAEVKGSGVLAMRIGGCLSPSAKPCL